MSPLRSFAELPITKYWIALLRLDALVEVLVTREHDVDAVLHEQRLELAA